MAATRVGVFRHNQQFLEDTNGNGIFDQGTDMFMPNFWAPGGFMAGDVPVAGDWTGDGIAKVGIYRGSTGTWYLDANNDGVFDIGDYTYQLGGCPQPQNCPNAQDRPVVGDWTGRNKSCIGVSRTQPDGVYWLLDLDCSGTFDNTPTDAFFPFGGMPQDVPVVGNWLGTPNNAQVGVVRCYIASGDCPNGPGLSCHCHVDGSGAQSQPFFWLMDKGAANAGTVAYQQACQANPQQCSNLALTTDPANHPVMANAFAFGGLAGDMFVPGDWYNTGTTTAGVFRPSGIWILDGLLPGFAQVSHPTALSPTLGGVPGDVPVAGKWTASSAAPFAVLPYTGANPVTVLQSGPAVVASYSVYVRPSATVTPSYDSLPAGVSVSFSPTSLSSNGTINVSIAASGAATLGSKTVTVFFSCGTTCAAGPIRQDLSVSVIAPLGVSTTSISRAQLGVTYSQTLQATGGSGSYTWSVVAGALPASLTLGSGGTITGTPVSAGNFTFIAQVSDGLSTASRSFTLSIVAPPLAITTASSLPSAQQGVRYNQTLNASGGSGPYIWSALTQLPSWMTLSNGGVLSGTPTSAETWPFTIQVSDGSNSASQQFSINVTPAPTFTLGAPTPKINIPFPAQSLPYSVNFTLAITGVNGFTCCVGISLGLPNQILATYTTPNGELLTYQPGALTVNISSGVHDTTSGLVGNVNLYTNDTSGINALPGQGTYNFYFAANSGSTTIYFSVPVIVGSAAPQYQLSLSYSPGNSGVVAASPSGDWWGSGWYPAGTLVTLTATPAAGYQFVGFSGATTSNTSPTTLTMNANASVMANFSMTSGVTQTITSSPPGRQLTVDGVPCTTPCNYLWPPGTSHPVSVATTQPGTAGTQYVFAGWSDSGAVSHSIVAPAASTVYSANFTTQYYLTTSAQSGGTISPASGWHNSGDVVNVTASSGNGYVFTGFIGSLTGTASSQVLTVSGAANVTATFDPIGTVMAPKPRLANSDSGGNLMSQVVPDSPYVEPGTTKTLYVCLIDQTTGSVVQRSGVRITIQSIQAQAYSGYHDHDDGARPAGYFQTQSGLTTSNGCYPDSYTNSSGVAGIEVVTLASDYGTSTSNITIQHPGLVAFPASHFSYTLKPPNAEHQNAYNCTQNCVDNTTELCDAYFQVTGSTLQLNDASLPWGGRFDIGPNYWTRIGGVDVRGVWWGPPHLAHTGGLNVDIVYQQFYDPTRSQGHQWDAREVFRTLLRALPAQRTLSESNHYHLQYSH
jgi:hypothetical protein